MLHSSRHFTLPVLLLLAVNQTAYGQSHKLMARSGWHSGYQLPARSFPLSANPVATDQLLAFTTITYKGSPNPGICLQDGEHVQFHHFTDSTRVSYVYAQETGISFSTFADFEFTGFYQWNKNLAQPQLLYSPDDLEFVQGIYEHRLLPKQQLAFKTNIGRKRAVVLKTGEQTKVLTKEGKNLRYLFSPDFGDQIWASKIAVDSLEEACILKGTYTGESQWIACNQQKEPASPFAGFDNSVQVVGEQVLFVGQKTDGKRCIVVHTNETNQERLCDQDLGLELESFLPQMNDKGDIVFRAFDQNKVRGIYVWTAESQLVPIVSERDTIESDLGPQPIYASPDHPGFGGRPTINNQREVVFSVSIGKEEATYSKAIYMHSLP